MGHSCTFSAFAGRYAIVRLPADAILPFDFPTTTDFVSVTRTRDELSIVCPEDLVPSDGRSEGGWRVLKLQGPFAFDQIGILASVANPLAAGGVSIFVVSTFETDYVLVKADQLDRALDLLVRAGHRFVR